MFLPTSVPSLLGPVTITQSAQTDKDLDKDGALGRFSMSQREIQVSQDMPPALQIATLGHEVFHVILEDSSMKHFLDEKSQEGLCDAFGVWFAHMVQVGFIVLPK